MLSEGESFLYPEKIENIAQDSADEANGVDDKLAEFKA
jgi:hypothetical protein